WVEYCNGTGNTSWANLRRQHGHPDPYRVRYWGLGNEMYGGWQIGNMNAHDYVKKARAFAMVMKRTDPSIELIGCGQNGWSEWDEITLGGLAELIDFHSIHLYTGGPDHYATVFQSHQAERAIRICSALIERVRHAQRIAHPIHIAFDEWNVWWRTRSHEDRVGGVEERYNLSDALAVATYLNGFIRHCRTVRIANFAQLVNAIAPIFTNPKGLFVQTIYHPLRLYAEHTLAFGLDVHVEGETYELRPEQESPSGRVHHVADLGPFTLIDAAASCDEAGRAVSVALVNRDRDRDLPVTLDLGAAAIAGAGGGGGRGGGGGGGGRAGPAPPTSAGAHGVFEQLEGRARERPHVALAVGVARLDRDHALDGAGHGDARVARGVAVAVARRPARARLRQPPRRAQQLAHRPGLELRVRLAARADAFDRPVAHAQQPAPRGLRGDHAAAHEVRGGAGPGEQRRGDEAAGRGFGDGEGLLALFQEGAERGGDGEVV